MSDAELRAWFAQAVVKPNGNALLINEDNTADRWVPLVEALRSGRAFAGDVRPDILALDWDRPDGLLMARAFGDAVAEHGFPTLIVASGRTGHAHSFSPVGIGPTRKQLIQLARASGGVVRRTIRPPLAPHRLGLPCSIFLPTDVEAARDIVRTRPTVIK